MLWFVNGGRDFDWFGVHARVCGVCVCLCVCVRVRVRVCVCVCVVGWVDEWMAECGVVFLRNCPDISWIFYAFQAKPHHNAMLQDRGYLTSNDR